MTFDDGIAKSARETAKFSAARFRANLLQQMQTSIGSGATAECQPDFQA